MGYEVGVVDLGNVYFPIPRAVKRALPGIELIEFVGGTYREKRKISSERCNWAG
jgi:hypothetical protein